MGQPLKMKALMSKGLLAKQVCFFILDSWPKFRAASETECRRNTSCNQWINGWWNRLCAEEDRQGRSWQHWIFWFYLDGTGYWIRKSVVQSKILIMKAWQNFQFKPDTHDTLLEIITDYSSRISFIWHDSYSELLLLIKLAIKICKKTVLSS